MAYVECIDLDRHVYFSSSNVTFLDPALIFQTKQFCCLQMNASFRLLSSNSDCFTLPCNQQRRRCRRCCCFGYMRRSELIISMRVRDLGILLVAAIAAFLALQGKDTFVAKRRFMIDIDPAHWKNHHTPADNEKIPSPIVADIDGDGSNELIVVTRDPRIIIYEPSRSLAGMKPGHKGRDDMETHLLIRAESTLLSKAKIRTARQPVAFNVGYLSEDDKEKHIIVLTHDWSVLCFDHNLKLIWEQHPVKRKMADVYHKEAALMLSTIKVRGSDKGLVVVGAAHELAHYDRYYKRAPKVDGKTHKKHAEHRKKTKEDRQSRRVRKHLIQSILRGHSKTHDALVQEAASREARVAYKKEKKLENLRHFSYFAMDGRTGAMRWKQSSGDWTLHDENPALKMVPQHNYKLDFHTEAKHAGEVDWRQYRVSMLSSLPHKWNRGEDTHFEIAHFSKKRSSSVSEDAARSAALHNREVGLFESAPLPASKGSAKDSHTFAKEADDKHKPNVLVSHTHNGIEVLHLFTGRPLCQLPLPSHALHADINHDGVIDRVESIIVADGETASHQSGHDVMGDPPNCFGWVLTGSPPTHALFNKTICTGTWNSVSTLLAKMQKQTKMLTRESSGDNSQGDEEEEAAFEMHAALPAMVARSRSRDTVLSRSVQMHDLIFAVSDGTVSSYTPAGYLNWQLLTSAWWTNPALVTEVEEVDRTAREEERHLIEVEPYAEIVAFKPQLDKNDESIIVIGSHNAVLISQEGVVLANIPLPDVPISPAIIGDFDSDGYNDLIITTRTGYHGYTLASRGNHILSFLLGSLLVMLGFMFLMAMSFSSSDLKGRRAAASSSSSSSQFSGSTAAAAAAAARRMKKERATD